jgi:hypothetical protein
MYNDSPYGVDARIVHLVVWSKIPFVSGEGEGEGEGDGLSPASRQRVQAFVQRVFLARMADAERVSSSYRLGPPCRMSASWVYVCVCEREREADWWLAAARVVSESALAAVGARAGPLPRLVVYARRAVAARGDARQGGGRAEAGKGVFARV